MSEIKHTPGPWKLEFHEKSGNAVVYGPRGDGDVRSSDGMGPLFSIDCSTIADRDKAMFPEMDPEAMANARVAVTAPELLHALIGLLETYGKPDEQICCSGFECGCQGATTWQEAEHYARAALAKAEGRQP